MPGAATHLAIADRIYAVLGGRVLQDAPLFYGGSIAPDAVHAKQGYQRADKKRSHLCDGIRSYGYGYPEMAALFRSRLDAFIRDNAGRSGKDLYLGYVVHLMTDEIYLLSTYKRLETALLGGGALEDMAVFRKKLADEVNSGEHRSFFREDGDLRNILPHEYAFSQNVEALLNQRWDYAVENYMGADEINASKRWVLDTCFKREPDAPPRDRTEAVRCIDASAEEITARLSAARVPVRRCV
ncbi:MAG: zinc dependent phospholipase C family protein [Oscillospiraceae bacterium]|jgi:hypothetical protein|nr:zinc dependent phospholipase C family protein [Oscillospiraceae bacterium]